MLNRRLIRIKVFKVLYSVVASGSDSLIEAEKTLNYSCEKTLHLYYFMLNAAVALRNAAQTRIETGLKKFNPTPEERNPNRKFALNAVSSYLAGDPRFVKYCEDHGLLWNDDLGFVLSAIVRNLEHLRSHGTLPVPGVFLKDDDREFAVELLRAAVRGYGRYMDIVVSNTSNWDPDRVVTTDLVLIVQGIAEAVRFPNIPLKVTINEYVEISKFYSTGNSKVFVNGLLDRILRKMVDTGEVVKTGRGLIEN